MKIARIYFQTTPFEGIIKSAYETLRVECQGSLFGRRNPKTLEWFIESILPSQLVDRKPDGVYFINKLAATREEAELIKEKIQRISILKSSLFSARIEGNPLTIDDFEKESNENEKKIEIYNLKKGINQWPQQWKDSENLMNKIPD